MASSEDLKNHLPCWGKALAGAPGLSRNCLWSVPHPVLSSTGREMAQGWKLLAFTELLAEVPPHSCALKL